MLHSTWRDATQVAPTPFTNEENELSRKGERDCRNEQTRSPVWPNASVRCPHRLTKNSETMDGGMSGDGWQFGRIEAAAGAKWRVPRTRGVGSAAAEKVSAAVEKVSAAAEKRSAVAKVGAVVAERKGCGREDSTLRSRTLNPADAK